MLEILVSLVSGLILGLGVGGGTVLIPALTLLCDVPVTSAIGVNLLGFLPASAVTTAVNCRHGLVKWEKARPYLLLGILGSVSGALLSLWIDTKFLKYGFNGFLLLIGFQLLYKSVNTK